MSDWWRNFFNEDYVDIYGTEDAKKSVLEVEGVISILKPKPGSRILDLCCGYGRHAIGLAAKGFNLTGFDFSPVLLRKARVDAAESGMRVDLIRGDMRSMPFRSAFDYVVNMLTAFAYFDDENDDQRVLDGVSSALVPGGELLLDTINRERVLSRFQKKSWEELDGGRYALDEREIDLLSSRISARTLVLGKDERTERRHSMRLYALTEMGRMTEKTGMSVASVYGHLDGREYKIDTPRMVIRARKNRT